MKLTIREGIVREEFILLSRKPDRTEAENERLAALKTDMANHLLALPSEQAYDVSQVA
ncbi:hypothetical protein [Devosia lacusdianchii]|uniref:hypothetical protein n=1 Tax=Devosia lacusdianchii TaxID=2917991 RepID=UPI001F06C3DC|nr:hypothetical protein [Devosia sp. JXJ CY 41]